MKLMKFQWPTPDKISENLLKMVLFLESPVRSILAQGLGQNTKPKEKEGIGAWVSDEVPKRLACPPNFCGFDE